MNFWIWFGIFELALFAGAFFVIRTFIRKENEKEIRQSKLELLVEEEERKAWARYGSRRLAEYFKREDQKVVEFLVEQQPVVFRSPGIPRWSEPLPEKLDIGRRLRTSEAWGAREGVITSQYINADDCAGYYGHHMYGYLAGDGETYSVPVSESQLI